jgi:hypothetical protein
MITYDNLLCGIWTYEFVTLEEFYRNKPFRAIVMKVLFPL